MVRIEYDGARAEQPELFEVVENLFHGADTCWPLRVVDQRVGDPQREARISLSELGRRVRLSSSATTERVRNLESLGVINGDDCYTLKVAATSMEHLESLMDELAGFGSTTTSVVYSQALPYRGPARPSAPATSPASR